MKKILLLIPSMTEIGGTERMVDNLSRLFVGAGHTVVQVTFDPPGAPVILSNRVRIYQLGPIPRLPLVFRLLSYALAAFRLTRLKRRLRPDITISNLWRSDLISQLSFGSDKRISLCHINVVNNPSNHLMVKLRVFVAFVYRRFVKVVAVSEPLAKELSDFYGLAPPKIYFIDNFVFPTSTRKILKDDSKWFVWVGRMVPEKNVKGLLYAWAGFALLHTDVKLVLIGDGPLRKDLIRLAGDIGLKISSNLTEPLGNVIFMGQLMNPQDYIAPARALLLSSMSEGVGLVLLEAMSLGVPVLAADCNPGGVRATILGSGQCDPSCEHGVTTSCGVLLPVPDPENYLIWRPWLEKVAYDEFQWHAWSVGSKSRSERFSSEYAMSKWSRILDNQ